MIFIMCMIKDCLFFNLGLVGFIVFGKILMLKFMEVMLMSSWIRFLVWIDLDLVRVLLV